MAVGRRHNNGLVEVSVEVEVQMEEGTMSSMSLLASCLMSLCLSASLMCVFFSVVWLCRSISGLAGLVDYDVNVCARRSTFSSFWYRFGSWMARIARIPLAGRDRLYITEKASGLLRDGSVWLLLISLLSESC